MLDINAKLAKYDILLDGLVIKGRDKQNNIKHVFEWISLKQVHALYKYIYIYMMMTTPHDNFHFSYFFNSHYLLSFF